MGGFTPSIPVIAHLPLTWVFLNFSAKGEEVQLDYTNSKTKKLFFEENQAGKGSCWFRQKPNVFQKSDQLRIPNMMLEEDEELVHEVIKEISSLDVHKITKSICLRIVIFNIFFVSFEQRRCLFLFFSSFFRTLKSHLWGDLPGGQAVSYGESFLFCYNSFPYVR